MLNSIITGSEITLPAFLICTAVSLILGLLTGYLCMYREKPTQSFVLTLAVLPAIVQVIIMLVNGNIGTGVAVAGAFGLVRFRSAAGSAREIGLIFLSMAIGLATGMGFVGLAVLLFVILAGFILLLHVIRYGGRNGAARELRITIGENLDYDGLFDDIFATYTNSAELSKVKTTNMGTLYELTYDVVLKTNHETKQFLDALRCRNGNLTIVCGKPVTKDAL